MPRIVYSVGTGVRAVYYPTQEAAMTAALEDAKDPPDDAIFVERHEIEPSLKGPEFYAALLNGKEWCADMTELAQLRNGS